MDSLSQTTFSLRSPLLGSPSPQSSSSSSFTSTITPTRRMMDTDLYMPGSSCLSSSTQELVIKPDATLQHQNGEAEAPYFDFPPVELDWPSPAGNGTLMASVDRTQRDELAIRVLKLEKWIAQL